MMYLHKLLIYFGWRLSASSLILSVRIPLPELMERIWKFSFVLQYNKGWKFELHNFLANYDTNSIQVKTQG